MRQIIYLRRELLALLIKSILYLKANGELTIDMPSFMALLGVAKNVQRVEGGITSAVSISGSAMTNNTIPIEVLLSLGAVSIEGGVGIPTATISLGEYEIAIPECIITSEANTNIGRGISSIADIASAEMSGRVVQSYSYYTEPNEAGGTTVYMTSDYITALGNTVYIGGTPNGT